MFYLSAEYWEHPIHCDCETLVLINSMCHNDVCQILEKLPGIFNFIKDEYL